MIINKRNFIDYGLLFLVIAVSGIPYFSSSILYIPVSSVLIIVFLLRGHHFDKEFLVFLILLTILTIFQTYIFDFFSIQTILGVYLRVLIGYLIVKILDKKFTIYYINIFYYLSIMGTAIFLSISLFPFLVPLLKETLLPLFSILNFAGSVHETIIIYNFKALESFRNSGPFWEPGAFGGYLFIAIIFISFNNQIVNKKTKIVILTISLLTTFSTTAYIALAVFIFSYYYKNIKHIFLKIAILLILLYGSYYTFFNVNFLGDKIETQIERALENDAYEDLNTQRFLSISRDFQDFKGYEISGRGFNDITRYSQYQDGQIRTSGVSDILVKMGIPFTMIMMFFLYRSFYSVISEGKRGSYFMHSIVIFITIIMILMSQVYFNFPMFWGLSFLFIVYKNSRYKSI